MAFACMPYGQNVSDRVYNKLNHFYNDTGEGCCGCMETAAKWVVVAPAHLLTAAFLIPALMIYDLAMTAFFALANLCTVCIIKELRDRFLGHGMSLLLGPNAIRYHQIVGLFLPCAYRGNEIIANQGGIV